MAYTIKAALTEVQVIELHDLYQKEWWTKGRTLDEVRLLLQHSDVVIALIDDKDDSLVGFSRVLTDRIFKALVFDVIVREDKRSLSLGKKLMDAIQKHPDLQEVKSFELYALPEMEAFYKQWGFTSDLGELTFMRSTSFLETQA